MLHPDFIILHLSVALYIAMGHQYLGTPDNKYQGLIQQYYQTHQTYPADVTLNNFDIYSPFSSIGIKSWFNYDYWDNGPNVNSINSSDSNSTIDLSNLTVDLAADIQFADKVGPTINELIQELQNDREIWNIGSIDPNSSKASDEYNSDQILGQLSASKYEPLTNGITFSGNLKSGVAVPIHWYYRGFEGTINVESL